MFRLIALLWKLWPIIKPLIPILKEIVDALGGKPERRLAGKRLYYSIRQGNKTEVKRMTKKMFTPPDVSRDR